MYPFFTFSKQRICFTELEEVILIGRKSGQKKKKKEKHTTACLWWLSPFPPQKYVAASSVSLTRLQVMFRVLQD
jgi:hypothetical protein